MVLERVDPREDLNQQAPPVAVEKTRHRQRVFNFNNEAVLHTMVEQIARMLPLTGTPGLAVGAREVRLGTSFADLLAVEPSGRLVVIEVKLARNAEG